MDAQREAVPMIGGFLLGLFIGGTAMALIVGSMAAGEIDGIAADAFEQGKAAQRRADLEGDEATQLGRIGA